MTQTPVALGPAGINWRRFDASHPASITAADIDGDGQIDLFIPGAIDEGGTTKNAVLLNRGAAGFALDSSHPLAAVADVRTALWGDFDNDGLIDVYLCRDGANQLWRQTAKGQWADITAAAHADGGGGATIDGALFDADHDGDLDLLLIKRDGGDELLNNNGDGTFRPIGVRIGLTDPRPSSAVVIADLDADRDADIVVIKKAAPPTVLLNDRTWQYHREPGFGTSGPSIVAAVAGDTDADGRVEIYTSGEGGIARWTRASSRHVDICPSDRYGQPGSLDAARPGGYRWRRPAGSHRHGNRWPRAGGHDSGGRALPRRCSRRGARRSPAGRSPCSTRRADRRSSRCRLAAAAHR